MMPSRVVIGVAADMSSGGTKTTTTADASGTSANQTTVFDSETVRGRLGYAADNVLFYATGGWAWSNDQFVRTQLTGALNNATAGTDEAVNKYLSGWTAGGGIAYAFAQNWNVFAEYRYTSFGSSAISLPFSQLTTTSTTSVSAIEFGVNYKFNSGAPCRRAPHRRLTHRRRRRHWSTSRLPLPTLTIGPAFISAVTAAMVGRRRRERSRTRQAFLWRRTATA